MEKNTSDAGFGKVIFFQAEWLKINFRAGNRFVGQMNDRSFNQSDRSGPKGHVG